MSKLTPSSYWCTHTCLPTREAQASVISMYTFVSAPGREIEDKFVLTHPR